VKSGKADVYRPPGGPTDHVALGYTIDSAHGVTSDTCHIVGADTRRRCGEVCRPTTSATGRSCRRRQ